VSPYYSRHSKHLSVPHVYTTKGEFNASSEVRG
jgi:hypothetical protein